MNIDKLIRSNRRSVSLIITKDANLEVRAPFNVSLDIITEFVTKKKSWIEKKKAQIINLRAQALPQVFADGKEFIYAGNRYKLQVSDCEAIHLSDVLHFPKSFLPEIKQHVIAWYKTQSLKKIIERANYYATLTQLKYKYIKLSNATKSWGYCDHKESLHINWRLIIAPPDILDYVIVHELVHLAERNHSKRFWDKVQATLPNYKEHKNWLRQKGNMLMLS